MILIEKWKNEGKIEGKREGKIEGKREGKIEGKREGKFEAREEVAVNLLRLGMKLPFIQQVTGFTQQHILQLKSQL